MKIDDEFDYDGGRVKLMDIDINFITETLYFNFAYLPLVMVNSIKINGLIIKDERH